MKIQHAIKVLRMLDQRGRYVFTKHDLQKLFPEDNLKTLSESLNRLVKTNILRNACRGIYVNENATSFDSYTLERIAKTLRRGEYSYISLESMLSDYGVISQVPIDRLTLMTTGRKGVYKTPYGVIEFTHTKRSLENILDNTVRVDKNPLRIAHKAAAYRDLKRVGRNVDLVDQEELLEPKHSSTTPKPAVWGIPPYINYSADYSNNKIKIKNIRTPL